MSAFGDVPLPDDIVGSRYKLERPLGSGGRGLVFLARDLVTESPVALKLVRERRYGHRLLFEAQLLARLAPLEAVCRLLDCGEHSDGRPFIVIEWIDGKPIDRMALTINDILTISMIICRALAKLHILGYLHRDVKPTNVVVPIEGSEARVAGAKLIDFDLARPMFEMCSDGQSKPLFGRTGGTADYMAPEQLTGRHQTAATDIYGLGATMFSLLYQRPIQPTGNVEQAHFADVGLPTPFIGAYVVRRLTEEIVVPVDESVPRELQFLLSRMLRIDSRERPSSIADVQEVLGGLANSPG
jgi:serine/threonine protein kinase